MVSASPEEKCGITEYTKKLCKKMKRENIKVTHKYIKPLQKNPLYYIKKACEISGNCDILHIQLDYTLLGKLFVSGIYTFPFYATLRLLSIWKKFKIVTTMHEVWSTKNVGANALWKLYRWLTNLLIVVFSHKVCVLSENGRRVLLEQKMPQDKIVVVPFGSYLQRRVSKKRCKKALKIPPKCKVITILGFIRPSKGHDILFEACKNLKDDYIILVAGSASLESDKRYLKKIIKIAPKTTRFLGFVKNEELKAVLSVTDVLVLPYREITQSAVLNLAAGYRVATVASNLPYFIEINKKYGFPLLFKSESSTELARLLNLVLNNKNVKRKLQKAAVTYAKKNTLSGAVKKTKKLYLELLI